MKHLYSVVDFPRSLCALSGTPWLLTGALVPGILLATNTTPQASASQTVSATQTASANLSADAGLYTLTPHYRAGDRTRYLFTVHRVADRKRTSELDTLDTKFRMLMQETTTKVPADGGATLEESIEKADGDFDEHEIELTAAIPKVTLIRDRLGATRVETTGGVALIQEPVTEVFQLLGRIQRSCLPPTSVHVGDAWKFGWQETGARAATNETTNDKTPAATSDTTSDNTRNSAPNNTKSGNSSNKDENYNKTDPTVGTTDGKIEGTGRLIGQEMVDGQPTLKIKLEFTSLLHVPDIRKNGAKIDVTSHFTGTANVDATTYKFVRMQGVSDDTLPEGEHAKTDVSLVLAPAAKAK